MRRVANISTTTKFRPEGTVWYSVDAFDILANNITVPGLSPVFPFVHCTADHDICQLTTGEAEINAAASIVGVNPRYASLASVTFARYEVQAALEYEFDPRDLPANFSTGYIPQGSTIPSMYPQTIYGTEVFELNLDLRDIAIDIVRSANVSLNDTKEAAEYRALYAPSRSGRQDEPDRSLYEAASRPPSIIACDGVTADTYFSGTLLNQAFDNYTTLVTNGTGRYCGSGQEDSATLEALLRATLAKRVDFARVIAMRTASDYTAPPLGSDSFTNLMEGPPSAVDAAVANIPIAGIPIIQGIISQWEDRFSAGIKPTNYIGDILGSLNGTARRDFGPFEYNDNPIKRAEQFHGVNARQQRRSSHKIGVLPRMNIV